MSRNSLLKAGALAIGVLALIILPLFLNRYGVYISTRWAILTIAAIGLNLTLGYAGQVSLAQGAFVGIGAYAGALMTTAGWPFVIALIVAIILCFVVGWLLGYPALRVQHHYLAFVTLAFSTLAFLVFRNEEWLTGGIYGIVNVPRPSVFGISTKGAFGPGGNPALPFYYFSLFMLALVSFAVWWLVKSPWGRAFVALRENPVRALSLGVDTRRYILMAFAIGSALGGVSGVLYGPLVEFVDPTPFGLNLSLDLLLMVIVGGAGYFFGPYLGALIAVLLPEWLRFTEGLYLILYALLVMVMLAVSPKGLIGIVDQFIAQRRTKAASAARAAAEPTLKGAP